MGYKPLTAEFKFSLHSLSPTSQYQLSMLSPKLSFLKKGQASRIFTTATDQHPHSILKSSIVTHRTVLSFPSIALLIGYIITGLPFSNRTWIFLFFFFLYSKGKAVQQPITNPIISYQSPRLLYIWGH